MLHWDGHAWAQVASPHLGDSSGIAAITALSPTDAWASGGSQQGNNPGNTLILHWNGTTWTRS